MTTTPGYTVDALLPCPFCGCDDHESSPFPTNHKKDAWCCRCGNPDCNADILADSPEEAVTRWNRRSARAAQLTAQSVERASPEPRCTCNMPSIPSREAVKTYSPSKNGVMLYRQDSGEYVPINDYRCLLVNIETHAKVANELLREHQGIIDRLRAEVERASPAKDANPANLSRESRRILNDEPLASQMRPQSAVQGWRYAIADFFSDCGMPIKEASLDLIESCARKYAAAPQPPQGEG